MFSSWQSFYQMTGEAAATLIGLLFIVTTLMSGRPVSPTSMRGVNLFVSPTVFHLSSVLAVSALTLAPDGEGLSLTFIMAGWAILGLVHTVVVAIRVFAIPDPSHWSDAWWYGAAPAAAYLALATATVAACAGYPHAGYILALSLLALLLVSIRNAWDLITWIAPRRDPS